MRAAGDRDILRLSASVDAASLDHAWQERESLMRERVTAA